jgi:Protein of unknown function (DUF4236)
MGFRFRKSVKMGPFRVTASRSGLSISAGIKGARITAGPRGTYITIGFGGVSYRQRIDSPNTSKSGALRAQNMSPDVFYDITDPATIRTADIHELVESSNQETLNLLNERISVTAVAPFVFAVVFILSLLLFFTGSIFTWITLIFGGIFGYFVSCGDRNNRITPLYYEMDALAKMQFEKISDSVRDLGISHRIWRIEARQNTHDWKRNAGAGNLVKRSIVTAGQFNVPHIRTNLDVYSIKMNGMEIYFLPDYILVYQKGRYGAIDYHSLNVNCINTTFIKTGNVPFDAEVVRYTWQFVRRDGGPDRRFSNNRQIPVIKLAEITFKSTNGLNLLLYASNLGFAHSFVRVFSDDNSSKLTQDYSLKDISSRNIPTANNYTTYAKAFLPVLLQEIRPSTPKNLQSALQNALPDSSTTPESHSEIPKDPTLPPKSNTDS